MRALPTLIALALGALVWSGCSVQPERECEADEEHCAGAVALQCVEFQSTLGNGARWKKVSCLSERHCQVQDSRAFCTLTEATTPECAGQLRHCDGNTSVSCQSGFETGRSPCASCTGDGVCNGGSEVDCYKGPCAPELSCIAKRCQATCTCANGSICPACEVAGVHAGGTWLCIDGICNLRF